MMRLNFQFVKWINNFVKRAMQPKNVWLPNKFMIQTTQQDLGKPSRTTSYIGKKLFKENIEPSRRSVYQFDFNILWQYKLI